MNKSVVGEIAAADSPAAPQWETEHWLNADMPISLSDLRGRVVMVHAFQMLCPACVSHGIPQAKRVAELFSGEPLTVVGLHTVFEHHAGMALPSLQAFVHEYRIGFPVGVDKPGPGDDPIPRTMRAYGMRGTPTTVLIDAEGRLRRMVFGVHDDLLLGSELRALISEAARSAASIAATPETAAVSSPESGRSTQNDCLDGCALPV